VCLTIQVRIRRYPQRDKVVRKWTELVQPGTAGESGKTNDGKILVVVADTGPGVDTPKVDQIFDAFFTTKPDGLGMGLSICRSIIEAHGGRLWMSPNDPAGSVFSFTLKVTGLRDPSQE
jgi:signal transduction histidine kinase